MKTFAKFALTAIGLVLILVAIGAIVVLTQMGRLSQSVLEEVLSQAFNAQVRVASVAISPRDMSLEIRGFVLANPEKFKEGPAIECQSIRIAFDGKTLLTRSPILHSVDLDGVDVYYRYEVGQGTNIGQLARQAAEGGEGTRRYVVETLRCEGAEIHFSTNLIPKSGVGLRIVTIHLENIGKEDPAAASEVISLFLRSLMKETMTLKGLLGTAVKSLAGEVRDLGKKAVGK